MASDFKSDPSKSDMYRCVSTYLNCLWFVSIPLNIKHKIPNPKKVQFTLATNESYKDKNGEKQTITQWHNVIAWGKLAENINLIVEKGNEVAIQGKLTYRSYTDQSGAEKYVTEVVAQEFFKITKKDSWRANVWTKEAAHVSRTGKLWKDRLLSELAIGNPEQAYLITSLPSNRLTLL